MTSKNIAAIYTVTPSQPAGELVYSAPVISMRIVRDSGMPVPRRIKSPSDIAVLLHERYAMADREIFVVVLLDTKNTVLAIDPVAVGSLDSAMISMREVFKSAIMIGAAAIIVAHNHPSGDPTPSPEDVAITRQIASAGKLLDIELLDHIVLGSASHVSLRDRGLGFDQR